MEKMQIGEYIRTDTGKIGKIIAEIYEYKDDYSFQIMFKDGIYEYWDIDDYITKHSKNIIDLLEIGDFVNGSYIFETGNAINGEKWVHTVIGRILYNEELKKAKILTKEQYENNYYEIGE